MLHPTALLRPLLVWLLLCSHAVAGGAPAGQESEPLRVGLRLAAPFVLEDGEGGYEGLAIDAWSTVADALDLEWEAVPMDLADLIEATAEGELDLAVGALTVTADREQRLDFSHPLLSSGLGIAVTKGGSGAFSAILRSLVSVEFLTAIAALGVVLLAVGFLVWLAERRRNSEQFARSPAGLLDGFWFSAVTMTTVGYGDKAPTSGAGRVVALVWMFASIIVISGFTGAIASSVTVDSLDSRIRGVEDLAGVRVGALEDSAAEAWLRDRGLAVVAVERVDEALERLDAGEVQAVVHDRPILRWLVRERYVETLAVLPQLAVRQDLAFALPPGSDLREPLNRALLDHLSSTAWTERRRAWLGE